MTKFEELERKIFTGKKPLNYCVRHHVYYWLNCNFCLEEKKL